MLRLQYERVSRRWTQGQLARIAGTHQSHVSLIELGRLTPTPDELDRLSRALGVAPAALLRPVVVENESLEPAGAR